MKGESHDTEPPQEDRGGCTQSVAQTPPFIADDLSIPAFLKREDTPESKAARERIVKETGRRVRRLSASNSRSTVSTGYATLDETGKAILRETLKTGSLSDAMRNRAVKALRRKATGNTMTQVGAKETALRNARASVNDSLVKPFQEAVASKAGLTALATQLTNGVPVTKVAQGVTALKPNGEPKKETTMANTATAKKAAPVKTVAKSTARKSNKSSSSQNARTPVKSKMQMVEDMLLTKKGATREEMSKASGWRFVDLQAQLERYKKRVPKAKLVEQDGRFKLV